jgi:hypothetical protein
MSRAEVLLLSFRCVALFSVYNIIQQSVCSQQKNNYSFAENYCLFLPKTDAFKPFSLLCNISSIVENTKKTADADDYLYDFERICFTETF